MPIADESGTHAPSRDVAVGIIRRLKEAGHEAWLVGGCVRDFLRGVEAVDYDIVTSASPDVVQGLFPHTAAVGIRFGILLVLEQGHAYQVATYRCPGGYRQDIGMRDFTINAMLTDTDTGRIIDEVGGRADLEGRLIRTVGRPEDRFAEDRLRMLRAIRFAANLGFNIDQETFAAISAHAPEIRTVSVERIADEMTRMLTLGGAGQGMRLLAQSGLLKEILPEVAALRGVKQPPRFHPEGDVWTHTVKMLDLISFPADSRLAWGVLLHDVGKTDTKSEDERGIHFYGHAKQGMILGEAILRRLRFSRLNRETILNLIRFHMNFIGVRDMRPSRLKRLIRTKDFDLALELHRLDCLASHGQLATYEFCRNKQEEWANELQKLPPLLNGRDLLAMGFQQGPLFGEILTAVEEAQLNGFIHTPEEARRLILRRWSSFLTKKG
ncbi:poly(A) polymerase [Syntrophus gentianae]|uniref:Poly(A) polymerase n=1 Tax=Syntrophus gentianae TaxID=43775 RepID=A0A1H7XLW0_9BACT|nr:CCA tRNA nucleotidyltransferase [Syntrophus gentianae]SEM34760.1 poly(A) polymerase [Syntrophus gentianae]